LNKSGAGQFCDNKNDGLGSKRLRVAETISDNDSSYRPESPEGSRSKRRRLVASASPVVESEPESRPVSPIVFNKDREVTPYDDNPELMDYKKMLDVTGENLRIATIENKKWMKLERYALLIKDDITKTERMRASTELVKRRLPKRLKDIGIDD
ncbi:hypothetical protein HWV62_21054, partial [Athelia sp. TMB]